MLERWGRDGSPFKWPVGVITLAQLNVCLYVCKAVNALRNDWENMPGGQITVSGALMTMNQLQWFTWFSRLRRFLPLPFLSALVRRGHHWWADTFSILHHLAPQAFDVLFMMRLPSEYRSLYVWIFFSGGCIVVFVCMQSGKRYSFYFFKACPPQILPPPRSPSALLAIAIETEC